MSDPDGLLHASVEAYNTAIIPPTDRAARLAEIRAFTGPVRDVDLSNERYMKAIRALRDLLAAYDTLADAVLAWEALPRDSMDAIDAGRRMVALARAGRRRTG